MASGSAITIGSNNEVDINGSLKINDTTNCTSVSTGALVVNGGIGIAKDISIGGWLNHYGGMYIRGGGFELFNDAYSNSLYNRWAMNVTSSHRLNIYQPNNAIGVYINSGSSTGWVSYSDERLKTDIQLLPNCLEKVMQIRPVSYKLKKQENNDRTIGFIAQDWNAVQPEVISYTETTEIEDLMGLSYTSTIPVLLGAIKEQQEIINSLKLRIEALENSSTP